MTTADAFPDQRQHFGPGIQGGRIERSGVIENHKVGRAGLRQARPVLLQQALKIGFFFNRAQDCACVFGYNGVVDL